LHPSARELVENAPLPEWGAEPFEDRTGTLEEAYSTVLMPCPSLNFPGDQQRPRFLERHGQLLMHLDCCLPSGTTAR
jgi:hypothetical protein